MPRSTRLVLLAAALAAGCSGRPSMEEADLQGHPGTAIVLDAASGAAEGVVRPGLAMERVFIAGDALRLATLLAGLEKGIVDPAGPFHCPGGERGEADPGAGPVTLREAFDRPCRHVFREIERKIPWREMASYLEEFGFGAPTGLGGPAEASGTVPDLLEGEGAWDLWERREIRMTPAQLAAFIGRLLRRDLPLRADTMERAIGILGGDERGRGAAMSGSFRERGFSYAWEAAALGDGRRDMIVLVFLLGDGAGVERGEAERIVRDWWNSKQGG